MTKAKTESVPAAADLEANFVAISSEGPRGNITPIYDGPVPVFQWQVAPAGPADETAETRLRIDNRTFVVCWVTHPTEELVYASLQARDRMPFAEGMRPEPAFRTENANIVYDTRRSGIVAIYGLADDFSPFVEAFRRAYMGELWNDMLLHGRSVARRQ